MLLVIVKLTTMMLVFFLRKENGTNYVFDSYVCAEIFQKLNHIKRNVNISEIIPMRIT